MSLFVIGGCGLSVLGIEPGPDDAAMPVDAGDAQVDVTGSDEGSDSGPIDSGDARDATDAADATPLPFTPTTISGCILWLRADKGITYGVSPSVSAWADQSGAGSGPTFSQGTALKQPTYVASGLNGKPAISFNAAASQSLTSAVTFSATAEEAFVVTQNATAAAGALWNFGGGPAGWYPYSDGRVYENFGSSLRNQWTPDSGAPLMAAHVYQVRNGGTTQVISLDDMQKSLAAGNVQWPLALTLGGNAIGGYYTGNIPELIVYNRVLSGGEHALVMSYLRGQYATP